MKIHAPFIIGSNLKPAINIGDTTLSFIDAERRDGRLHVGFELRGPDIDYVDNGLSGHFKSIPEAFECFLSFLDAAAEAMYYEGSDNRDLFPEHVMVWCRDHADAIAMCRCDITDEDGNVLHHLIEERE